ncbi:MAG: glycerophosphodiester phosphodiesterase [bacterium]|nr:glycerophosphodiester phosphodiesterase [bacterium]
MIKKRHKVAGCLLFISALTYLVAVYWTRPVEIHPFFANLKNSPEVIAHRGGWGLWPENTLYGFQRAVDLGADMLEMDVRATADSVLVILHDETLDRTTNGKGPVGDWTLKELKSLDAGYTWTGDGGQTFPYRGSGLAIPTLDELFDALPHARMNIEIKQPDILTALGALIRRHHVADRVMIASFDSGLLRRFRSQFPEIATSAGLSEGVLFYVLSRLHLGAAYHPNATALQIPYRFWRFDTTHPAFLSAARTHHLKIHYWTINDAKTMRSLVDLGVDGIITPFPDRFIALLRP